MGTVLDEMPLMHRFQQITDKNNHIYHSVSAVPKQETVSLVTKSSVNNFIQIAHPSQ
ncbi:hypothetical protein CHS0354_026937, partial [Potamilus streckersoni]